MLRTRIEHVFSEVIPETIVSTPTIIIAAAVITAISQQSTLCLTTRQVC